MKKKLNIKKVMVVFIILILLVVGGVFVVKNIFAPSSSGDTDKKPTTNTVKDNNEFSNLEYYHSEKLERYKAYKTENPTMSIEDIVTHVNMGIDKPFYSEDPIQVKDPEDLTVIINKVYSLPLDWEPNDLVVLDNYKGQSARKIAAEAFFDFREACKEQGFTIYAHSGYRSTEFQDKIYKNMINTYGQEYTDKYVSRPGQSEHTTGLCIDISIDSIPYEEIEQSSHYSWFREHLSDYGFILRYPEDKENLTGYNYESWHIRYLGKDLAKKVEKSGLTYDEYVARQP